MSEEAPGAAVRWPAWWFAIGMLTVFPARHGEVDRRIAGRGMALAPVVGGVLGIVAAVVFARVWWLSGAETGSQLALLPAVLGVGILAWLSRGLHLDGLADLADGLGSRKPAEQALDIMKRSDIGPFGVVTVLFALLIQVAALADAPYTGAVALVLAGAVSRLAITRACRAGIPAARPEGLGALVAGTVSRGRAFTMTLLTAAFLVAFAIAATSYPAGSWFTGARCDLAADEMMEFQVVQGLSYTGTDIAGRPSDSCVSLEPRAGSSLRTGLDVPEPVGTALRVLSAMAAGLAAASLLRRRAVRRLGGITGDVIGALVEVSATVSLVAWALL